ncbi:Autophagy-type protein 22 [Rhodotorula toruloides ATCC 204091]|uniref:Autophagy-related protein n=1 Tax=Rhodotorula toruloides TaxID=5286 RepID=A0A0K3CK13_RHOTO|nr:Autophagy-type protein 22 [Rhodotorula toruloides ATCC 204091]PRQ74516.1 autophagy-type protein 22 [Rhodotorula toruloides]
MLSRPPVEPPDSSLSDGEEAALLSRYGRTAGPFDTPEESEAAYTRQLWGVYAYSVASEVFPIVTGTLLLPVLLETYARQNGVLAPERVVACPPSGLGGAAAGEGEEAARCVVRLAGVWLDTASFSLMTYSASVFVQALTVISMGGLGDDPWMRHRLLTLFATSGSILCILFLFLPSASAIWPLCTLLALGANVAFGASIVCLNSYLPDLGRRHPTVLLAQAALLNARQSYARHRRESVSSSNTLLSASQHLARATDAYTAAKGKATGEISARAIAVGYGAGIAVLVALLPVLRWLGEGEVDGTWPLRVGVAISGMWWMVGTVPASIWLRPSTSIVKFTNSTAKATSLRSHIVQGWRGLGKMLREWRRLPSTFVFLGAWFILSDCFATITSTAILFAKTTLNLPTSSLVLVSILTPLAGLVGALAFPILQHRLHLTTHRTLLLLVSLATIIPLWGLVALRTSTQMYLLACVFGAIYGAFQALMRACFSELIPTSQSAQWFGVYSVTDKGSSFLGPLLVAYVTQVTGDIRHGFWVILILLLASLPVLAKVDMRKGSEDAEAFDREIKALAADEEVLPEEVEDV